MISDTELRHIEDSIARKRADFMRLVKDESMVRERGERSIKRIQTDMERDLDMIERKRRDLEREIAREEQDLNRRRSEKNRTQTNKH